MLIQMLIDHPQMLGQVLKGTPSWVWGLLAALTWLGASQLLARTASLGRIAVMPIVMVGLSVWGNVSGFGNSPQFGSVIAVWLGIFAATMALIAPMQPPAGTTYDAASRTFKMPGSWVPMVLIVGIFLIKYIVGVDLAMQPTLALDSRYVLIVGALYGLFSGIFAGRAARLWRLVARPAAASAQVISA